MDHGLYWEMDPVLLTSFLSENIGLPGTRQWNVYCHILGHSNTLQISFLYDIYLKSLNLDYCQQVSLVWWSILGTNNLKQNDSISSVNKNYVMERSLKQKYYLY